MTYSEATIVRHEPQWAKEQDDFYQWVYAQVDQTNKPHNEEKEEQYANHRNS